MSIFSHPFYEHVTIESKETGHKRGVKMDNEHLLTTKITIKGTFQDFQLYSGKFYLWTEQNDLLVYDWNKWMKQLAFVERPIYFEPQPAEQLKVHLDELEPFKERVISFTEPIYDSAIFDHMLYFSDPSGFYRFSLTQKNAKKEQISPLVVFQINLSATGRMALAAGEKGLFEYLASTHYLFRSTITHLTPRLIQLSANETSKTEWNQHDLIRYEKNNSQNAALLHFKVQKGIITFVEEKTVIDNTIIPVRIQELPLALSLSEPSMDDGCLFAYETDKRTLKKDPLYRSPSIQLAHAAHSAAKNQVTDLEHLLVQEAEQDLFVSFQNQTLLTCSLLDIKKRRIYTRTHNYRNQLHLLFSDQLVLYLFTEVTR